MNTTAFAFVIQNFCACDKYVWLGMYIATAASMAVALGVHEELSELEIHGSSKARLCRGP
jgi:hypothetical protein